MTHHRSRVCHFVIDCDDLDRATEFWSAALDTTEEPLSEQSRHIYRQLRLPDSEIRVLLQRTADAKVSKERMHLDLETDASRQRFSASRGSALHVGITSRSGATTSGCCVTPGARGLRAAAGVPRAAGPTSTLASSSPNAVKLQARLGVRLIGLALSRRMLQRSALLER
jgi:hypothetical protein